MWLLNRKGQRLLKLKVTWTVRIRVSHASWQEQVLVDVSVVLSVDKWGDFSVVFSEFLSIGVHSLSIVTIRIKIFALPHQSNEVFYSMMGGFPNMHAVRESGSEALVGESGNWGSFESIVHSVSIFILYNQRNFVGVEAHIVNFYIRVPQGSLVDHVHSKS